MFISNTGRLLESQNIVTKDIIGDSFAYFFYEFDVVEGHERNPDPKMEEVNFQLYYGKVFKVSKTEVGVRFQDQEEWYFNYDEYRLGRELTTNISFTGERIQFSGKLSSSNSLQDNNPLIQMKQDLIKIEDRLKTSDFVFFAPLANNTVDIDRGLASLLLQIVCGNVQYTKLHSMIADRIITEYFIKRIGNKNQRRNKSTINLANDWIMFLNSLGKFCIYCIYI